MQAIEPIQQPLSPPFYFDDTPVETKNFDNWKDEPIDEPEPKPVFKNVSLPNVKMEENQENLLPATCGSCLAKDETSANYKQNESKNQTEAPGQAVLIKKNTCQNIVALVKRTLDNNLIRNTRFCYSPGPPLKRQKTDSDEDSLIVVEYHVCVAKQQFEQVFNKNNQIGCYYKIMKEYFIFNNCMVIILCRYQSTQLTLIQSVPKECTRFPCDIKYHSLGEKVEGIRVDDGKQNMLAYTLNRGDNGRFTFYLWRETQKDKSNWNYMAYSLILKDGEHTLMEWKVRRGGSNTQSQIDRGELIGFKKQQNKNTRC